MLEDKEKLNAIAWKAKKAEVSYGQYSVMLSQEQKRQIYEDFDQYLQEKREKEEARLSKVNRKKNQKCKSDKSMDNAKTGVNVRCR